MMRYVIFYNNSDYKKLKFYFVKKYNINYYKINRFKRERLIHNFSDKKIDGTY